MINQSLKELTSQRLLRSQFIFTLNIKLFSTALIKMTFFSKKQKNPIHLVVLIFMSRARAL